MEARKGSRKKMIEWIKKQWKFLLGAVVTLISVLLIFRRKEDDAYLIENTTESGNKLAEQVLSSNEKANQREEDAENSHKEKLEKIQKFFDSNVDRINLERKKKIEDSIKSGNASRATANLAAAFGISIEETEKKIEP